MVARSDGTVRDLFPVAVGAAEGETLREWVVRERATRTIDIDLAFVDGSHRVDGVFLDLVYLGLLRPGAIVVVDDHQLPAVARAASFCVTNLGWRSKAVSAPDLDQWAALRTSAVPDTRSFDDDVEF